MKVSNNYVLSLSGGKDSMATGLRMWELGENIHSAIYINTGWDFDCISKYLDMFEDITNIGVVRFDLSNLFEYLMFDHPVFKRAGKHKGKLGQIGKGWASPSRRWCTTRKNEVKDKYIKQIDNAVSCIGFASDESHRLETKNIKKNLEHLRFPLIEWGMTEKDCLDYCRSFGFYKNGESPYDHFKRVSCFCCPLQKRESLYKLKKYYPEYWGKMIDMSSRLSGHSKRFYDEETVEELDYQFNRRLEFESRELYIFNDNK